MSTRSIKQIVEEAHSLTVQDLEDLITRLQELTRQRNKLTTPKWSDVRGKLKLPKGFDAQAWVSRNRRLAERTIGEEQ